MASRNRPRSFNAMASVFCSAAMRLPRALVVHENRYPETLDRALLAQYDSQIHDYYLARSSNNKVQTWSGQIKAILGKEARPFMLGFLQSKGFCLK